MAKITTSEVAGDSPKATDDTYAAHRARMKGKIKSAETDERREEIEADLAKLERSMK